MKKNLISLFIFSFCFQNSFAQGGIWTWINGDSTEGSTGIYGIQGIPSISNHPPADYEYVDWKDKQGNFWIYGGTYAEYSDLWKYNPLTNEWTWIKGDGLVGDSSVHGIKGIPSQLNSPGTRRYGAITWTDTTGNLWIFGGLHSNYLVNDMWRYEISSNEWTWMSGDSVPNAIGVHGTLGLPSIFNIPGARAEVASSWTDSLNNLWMFGGGGFDDAGINGRLNDLMKYDISTNEWTWFSGSQFCNASNNYGIKGVSSASNVPGARNSYSKWKDTHGNFWLMGGLHNQAESNDMWRFNPNINEWTWMSGTNLPNDTGIYQSMCVYDLIQTPSSRFENRATVTDNCDKFWLFGGTGNYWLLNDLWIFDPTGLKWNWIGGSKETLFLAGNYGSKGIPSYGNIIPPRGGTLGWWGDDNRFYIFAGRSLQSTYCDLWVFTPDSVCINSCIDAISISLFESIETFLCPGTCIDFLNLSINAITYQWSFPGATLASSTDVNPTSICYPVPGSYDVQLIASNANGSDTLLLTDYITVFPSPAPQSISQNGDTLFAIAGSNSYQWYFNGNLISGATDYFYVAPASGDYNVVATDSNDCEVEAVLNNVVAESSHLEVGSFQLTIYPNPVQDKFTIHDSQFTITSAIVISIFNVLGKEIYSAIHRDLDIYRELTVNCRHFPAGIYWLELSSPEKTYRTKFIKQ